MSRIIPRNTIWTIPNLLTIARILLTPVFVMAYINQRFDLAWALFAVAGLTDALDGFLARVLKQRTRLGAMLDPLADKCLLVASFICLGVQGWLPKWLVVLVVSRDAIIVGGLALLHFWGVDIKSRIHPIWSSKFTTTSQIGLVFFVMIQKTFDLSYPAVQSWLIALTAALTVVSGVHYVLKGFGFFAEEEAEKGRR
ncbi:CDP-alcohol phosphatidyltransferase family protein [Pseudodesulfovibrio senegalensis]|jgi:cardiolipin synthase|uniref:CDP-diacylglycerol--glycerol-3-phosphate 3-phosphatidyltransferase n=1 Tax=Pseudodesulfovibrio senegalensis TaxID=1721087 RepID=A0A6N6MZT0_9BACT|nr:CDP-alcohol phosphatidyltransferase family protein [Pseudodesulfovibrio senegalensis]KAB1441181.1 CDP-alcohol phosphatidyltransferase family protein [Pseudodesulfovibrio senegalensis]